MRGCLVGGAPMVLGTSGAFLFLFFFLDLIGLLTHSPVVGVGLGVAADLPA